MSHTWPGLVQRNKVVVWIAIGLLLAALTFYAGRVVEAFVETVEAGYFTRHIVRILWCVVLQLPWCLWGLTLAATHEPTRPPRFSTRSLLSLGLVTAIGVPISFLSVFVKDQTRSARDGWQQRQFRNAQRSVQRLCDIGSSLSLGERTPAGGGYRRSVPIEPRRALDDLGQAVRYTEQRIEQLNATSLTDAARLELAESHRSLGQDAQAEQVLAPLAERVPSAALTMAEIQLRRNARRPLGTGPSRRCSWLSPPPPPMRSSDGARSHPVAGL